MTNKKPQWIWYPGDFEIYHALKLNSRREERGFEWPAFWRLDDCWHNIKFRKTQVLSGPEKMEVFSHSRGYFAVNGKKYPLNSSADLSSGKNEIEIALVKTDGLPAVFIQADNFASDKSWETTSLGGEWLSAGCNGMYSHREDNPEIFHFEYEKIEPVRTEEINRGTLYDFGKQTFAELVFSEIEGEHPIQVFYGESETEALDREFSYIRDSISEKEKEYRLKARAFRFIFIPSCDCEFELHGEYEYLPFESTAKFECSDDKLNQIWDIAQYTFHLNSREFFLDGIKRDRWVWSGDAYQSYLINNYLFFDKAITKRTIIALRGKDPVERHINTIMDYSFYWIMSIWDCYFNTKDFDFIHFIYPRMKSLMDYCISGTNDMGFVEGREGDWVFIDWAKIDKTGALCAEQMLFVKALEAFSACSRLIGEDCSSYFAMAEEVRTKIDQYFWHRDKGAYIDSYESGKNSVTRHANIFAIIFDFADEDRKKQIIRNVIKNPSVAEITTPYFKFFELDALCRIGELEYVYGEMKSYWGGMVDLGASTFWEEYDPGSSFPDHYAMYGDKYGKSLCHAWGASPVYLLGRHFMGVAPLSPGYETFEIKPCLDFFSCFSVSVPLPDGSVHIDYDGNTIKVMATIGGGELRIGSENHQLEANKLIKIDIIGNV